jgi:dephospho-CoA kinase
MVARWLREDHDFTVWDADVIAREVTAPSGSAYPRLRHHLGDSFFHPDGTLNRAKLRHHLSHDATIASLLNQEVLPHLIRNLRQKVASSLALGHRPVFVEGATILEHGNAHQYDGILLITAEDDIRLQRLMGRDHMTQQDALALMARQMPESEKRRLATWIIDNNQDVPTLQAAVAKFAMSCRTP